MLGPVEVAAEFDAFLGQLVEVGQAHHLVAAAVGQDRAIPVHEFMQSAEPGDPLRAGAQHQVVGVAEDDVRTRCTDAFRLHALHRRRGADRHEGGRADIAALHADRTGPCEPAAGGNLKIETCRHRPVR